MEFGIFQVKHAVLTMLVLFVCLLRDNCCAQKFDEVIKEINDDMRADASADVPKVIKEYSDWLSKYQAADQLNDLEIPGTSNL